MLLKSLLVLLERRLRETPLFSFRESFESFVLLNIETLRKTQVYAFPFAAMSDAISVYQ